ncbi:MAG: hypothetical protein ACI82J_000059 [Sulfitobacter litoralis]|jgi:uncharacterized protein involved in propanediol utilization|uniref:hypothetical protein n=1 Tax=Sulfitobacter sp. M220 TaxID=2675333 RepID=UPI001F463A2B|nr:hypothetical protein [Sulfitobacter sp. M220]|tara:strand:- start:1592 stop:2473 length:882 start_codon:yes stop_codon:yes gene_type:complete
MASPIPCLRTKAIILQTIFDTSGASAETAPVFGHFGEWLQGRLGPAGPVVLVTMVCPAHGVQARFTRGSNLTLVHDGPAAINWEQLERLIDIAGAEKGRFALSGNLPVAVGAGASTAGLVAVARAAGVAEDRLPSLCLAVEGATDPLMLPHPDRVIWASRLAQRKGEIAAPPRADIIGGYFGAPIRTDAADDGFADISDLLPAWENATAQQDLPQAARLASVSADRTTALRGPRNDPSAALAQRLGALGYARAHTGSARAFIFAPGSAPDDAEQVLSDYGLTGAMRFKTGGMA